ncbi:MAG: hypothetical protein DDT39_00052 [Firmicutes bacterium]|nr:hypothetical protein [candidate division NPL-UPA2 bacterium]
MADLLPARGVNNLTAETSLTAATLREAVNADISRDGRVRRRNGRTRLVSGAAVHSLWAEDPFPYAVFVDGSTLFSLTNDMVQTPVAVGLALGLPVSTAANAGVAYWTNGAQAGCLTADGDPGLWAPEPPAGQPTLAVSAAGGLAAGAYQVAVTFRDAFGRESGTGLAAQINVPEGAGIHLTAVPQPVEAGMTTVRVYRTAANDSSLRHVIDVPVGMTQLLLGVAERGKALDTQHHTAMPVGHSVVFGHGRQWVARGNDASATSRRRRRGGGRLRGRRQSHVLAWRRKPRAVFAANSSASRRC